MKKNTFERQIGKARESLEALSKGASGYTEKQAFFVEVVQQLSVTLEELQVAGKELHQQNEELAAARQRYQELFDLAPDSYLVTDTSGIIREANRAASTLLSVHQEFLIGKSLVVFVAEGDRKAFHTRLGRLAEVERLEDWEVYLQPRGGKPFPAAITITTAHDREGRVSRLRWLVRDITEHKRQEALTQLVSFPELNPNPVVEVDLDGHVYYLNSAAKELLPGLQEAGLEHPWFADLGSVAELLKSGEKSTVRQVKIGDIEYEQIIYSIKEGRRLRIYSTEITERKRMEEALRESEQREQQRAAELEAVLQAVPAAVWIAHDPECQHITGNAAADEVLRLPRGAESSLTSPSAVRPVHFKPVKDGREFAVEELPVQQAARGATVHDFEFGLAFTDGTVRTMLGNATPLRDELGQPRGAVAAFVDISERKRMEEALQKSNRRLEIISNVASKLLMTTAPQEIVEDLCKEVMAYLDCHAFFNFLVA